MRNQQPDHGKGSASDPQFGFKEELAAVEPVDMTLKAWSEVQDRLWFDANIPGAAPLCRQPEEVLRNSMAASIANTIDQNAYLIGWSGTLGVLTYDTINVLEVTEALFLLPARLSGCRGCYSQEKRRA